MSIPSSFLPRGPPSSAATAASLSHILKNGKSRSSTIVTKYNAFTINNPNKHFATSPLLYKSMSTNATTSTNKSKQNQKIAESFNIRRAEYKKAVSKLRKEYAKEIKLQTKLDQESKQKQQALVTRQRLERQRLKNIRSAQNAMKQEQIRIQRKIEFEQHLEQQQVKREQRNQRFEDARRIVLNELEDQSKNWLTTPQEVDAVLCKSKNPFIEQQLWTRPGSFVGEAAPSSDAQFWRYESHTWKVQSTYPTIKEKLFEDIQEMVYDQSNVDYKVYWNKERLDYQNELEQKAKLRALVQNEGKRVLLQKQRQLMQDQHAQQLHMNKQDHVVPPNLDIPVPSTDVLANYEAMEKEGVKILQQNPSKFFVFANQDVPSAGATAAAISHESNKDQGDIKDSVDAAEADLGKPIGLVDPVRDSSFTNTPYPELVGRLPKPDLRTEREKKKQEREEKMLAAAAAAASGKDGSDAQNQMDADIENELSFGRGIHEEDVDYEHLANVGDEDDQEWEKGLDPILDKDLLDTPFDQRYTEDDIDWIISKLESKVASLKEIIVLEEGAQALKGLDTLSDVARPDATATEQNISSESASSVTVDDLSEEQEEDAVLKAMGPGTVKSIRVDEKGREYVSYDIVDDENVHHDDHDEFDDILSALSGHDINDLIQLEDKHNVIKTLNEEQLSALQSLSDDNYGTDKTAEDIKEALSKVPGLSDDQVQSLVDLELSLAQNVDVQRLIQKQQSK
jgi:hypothetical protein